MGTAARTIALQYEPRHPETTELYRLVAHHLESFLAEARAEYARGLPRYVERELRAYLACGIHAHGFLRAGCSACGKESSASTRAASMQLPSDSRSRAVGHSGDRSARRLGFRVRQPRLAQARILPGRLAASPLAPRAAPAVLLDQVRRVMQRLHMAHDAAEDFENPRLPEGHSLRRHVLYRLTSERWRGTSREVAGRELERPS